MQNFDTNAFNLSYLLLEYAKDLGITEESVVVILMIDHVLKKQPRSLISPELLSIKLSMPSSQVDAIMSQLNHRSLIAHIKEGKNIYTSLDPLFRILKERFVADILNVDAIDGNQDKTHELENIYQYFERELNRPLTNLEINQVYNWLKKYSELEVLDALMETKDVRKKFVTIKSVDKVLLERAAKNERKKEGRSSLSEESGLSLKEAAEVAKTNWLE